MKKARILLTLCLAAALVLGTAIFAGADELYPVTDLRIEGLPDDIAAGETIAAPTLTDAYGYTNITSRWLDSEHAPVTASQFEDGKGYYLELTITPKTDCRLSNELMVYAGRHYEGHISATATEAKLEIWYSLLPTVADISVTGTPTVSVGQTAPAVQISAPTNALYTVQNTYWHDEAHETFTGTFETGKSYYLMIDLEPVAGYDFDTDHITITVDGREADWNTIYTTGIFAQNITIVVEYSFKIAITAMDISVPQPQVGGAINLDGIALPQNVKLDPDGTSCWLDTSTYEPATGTFQQGHKYELRLYLVPDSSYVFDLKDNDNITVNGNAAYNQSHPWSFWSSSDRECTTVGISYSFLSAIDAVDVTVPTPEAGKPISLDGIVLPEHVKINTESSYWTEQNPYETDGEPEKATGTFQQGHKYYLLLWFNPENGYEFSRDTDVTLNGQQPWYINSFNDGYAEGADGRLYACYSFLEQISKIEVTGVTDAVVGQTATTEGIQISGATITDAYWYEETSGERFTGTFENGKAYYLYLDLAAASGTEFAEGCTVYVNGKEENTAYGSVACVDKRYSFKTVIDKVVITGVTDAVVGQTATTEGIQISGGTLRTAYWYDEEDGEPVTGAFENGKAYILMMYFTPEDGKEFRYGSEVTANGKECYDYYVNAQRGYAYLRYSFKTVIDKVELTGMPQFTVGGTASVESLKAPTDANYLLEAAWKSQESDNFTGTFSATGEYGLWIHVVPKDGYEFAEDVTFLIDGKAPETRMIDSGTGFVQVLYYYMPAREAITKVEILSSNPVVGTEIKTEDVKAPAGAKYTLEGIWGVSTDGKSWEEATGKFEEGKYYMLFVDVTVENDDDYYLANTLKIYLNGTEITDYEIYSENVTWMGIQKDFGKLTAPKDDENPKTGDMGLALAVVAAMASMGSALFLKKKEN